MLVLHKGQIIWAWDIYLGCELKVNTVKLINYSLEYQEFTKGVKMGM